MRPGAVAELGSVPLVDAVATHDAEDGRAAVFLVNRSLSEEMTVSVNVVTLGRPTSRLQHSRSPPSSCRWTVVRVNGRSCQALVGSAGLR